VNRIGPYCIAIIAVLLLAIAWNGTATKGLARVLKDDRQRLKIFYVEDSSNWALLVNRDGRLMLQKRGLGATGALWPTCTSTVSQSEVENLLQLMVARHFEKLPQKGFPNFEGASEAFPWKLHIISVDAGTTRGTWIFETGGMNGKIESIPPDFAAVETSLRKIRDKAIPQDDACTPSPDLMTQVGISVAR
jgi:hypothetical protein